MPLAPTIATQLTSPAPARPLYVWINGRDVTGLIKAGSLQIQDSGTSSPSVTNMRLEARMVDVPEVTDQGDVLIYDAADDAYLTRALVTMRQPIRQPAGYAAISLVAEHVSSTLDDTHIAYESRPVESDRARFCYLWGKYANGAYLSSNVQYVGQFNASLPATEISGVSLRDALETVADQSSPYADFYVDAQGRPHLLTVTPTAWGGANSSEGFTAPKNIDVDAPGATEVAGSDTLSIEYDSKQAATGVYVEGGTPEGSGLFMGPVGASGLSRIATVRAPESVNADMAAAVAARELVKLQPQVRGSVTVFSPTDGWQSGQAMAVTSAAHGLSSEPFIVRRVTTSIVLGGASPRRRHEIEFGLLRASRAAARRSRRPLPERYFG